MPEKIITSATNLTEKKNSKFFWIEFEQAIPYFQPVSYTFKDCKLFLSFP